MSPTHVKKRVSALVADLTSHPAAKTGPSQEAVKRKQKASVSKGGFCCFLKKIEKSIS
jgi:hypothetical protein